MSKVQEYADFSNGKNCFVCDTTTSIRSMAVWLNEVSYVGPVCQNKNCRRDARMNKGDKVTIALSDGKLMETHFHKMGNGNSLH